MNQRENTGARPAAQAPPGSHPDQAQADASKDGPRSSSDGDTSAQSDDAAARRADEEHFMRRTQRGDGGSAEEDSEGRQV